MTQETLNLTQTDVRLTGRQREAVEHGEGPLLIVAGAGTGKTLVVTQRIAHLIRSKSAKPEEILALTFTEKAAAEMSERVDVLLPYGFSNVQISTFHAFGDRILREFGLELGLNPDSPVLSRSEQVLFFREHLFEFPLRRYRPLGDPARYIQAILSLISRAKDEDVSPEEYMRYAENLREQGAAHPEDEALGEDVEAQAEIAATYAKYQELMAKEGRLDFGDQVFLVLRLLRERPSVLSKVRSRYRFLLVDEFQDTNYAQFQLVRLLGGEEGNITVVGDDDQSIYKFRGAAISNILSFMEIYPGARQVVLTDNYRSTQIILDTAYRLISHNNPDRLEVRNRIDKKLGARTEGAHPVEHLHCDSLTTESDRVARIIHDLVQSKGYGYGDIAVLVRANNDADPFLRAMNLFEIPWRFSGNRGLYSRPEIKLLMAFLRVITDPDDSASLYALAASEVYELKSVYDLNRCMAEAHRRHRPLFSVLESPEEAGGIQDLDPDTRSTIPKILKDIRAYLELSRDNITGVVLYQFITRSNYLKKLTHHETAENGAKIRNIARFFDVVWSFAQVAREDRVVHFIRHLDLLIAAGDDPASAEADPGTDAVSVMTVHKAKGLEWPVVFMVSLIAQKFPLTRRRDAIELPDGLAKEIVPGGDAHLAEERRLFYVGMTRAKERLFLTSAEDYGGVRRRKVSPFVLEALDRPHIDEVTVRSGALERIHRFAPSPDAIEQTMAPIPDDAVINLSHYQIDDYLTCPLKYKYVHILHLPFFHHTIVYGKAVHAAVETYFKHKMGGYPVTSDDLFIAYRAAWRNIGFLSREHEERRFESGRSAIRRFFEREEASGHVPRQIEEPFSFMMERNRIAGRWDRVDVRDGSVVIVDFKTSEVYRQEEADKKTRESLQLAIYAMAYAETHGELPEAVELHFLESGLVGSFRHTEKTLGKFREKMDGAASGIRRREYAATPGYNACRFCAYVEICPSAARV
ncbi:MAG TPA: PD-(D/E)XK nuclease family protein [bacterium]|nr:PD-(D/E)XK nuclease family protein [bacterium]